MSEPTQPLRAEWSSRWIFILAATGSAVGLGNIWKFPYITGQNGGAAFVLVYLFFVIAIGAPLLATEILIGRRGRHNPPDAIRSLAVEANRSKFWMSAGWLGMLSGFLVLSYYAVISGWALDYVFLAATNTFDNINGTGAQDLFNMLVSNPWQLLMWSTIILGLTIYVIARGLKRGIEIAIRFMFPIMLALLLILVAYSASEGYFMDGVRYLFQPDFSKIGTEGILTALGHALFTLSLSLGIMMMYGAYVPKHVSIVRVSIIIAIADTFIALLAGLAIFPIVFANNLEPAAGPGLIFQTLPIAFGHMPLGALFATLFFVMVVFAALTSTISLLEAAVAWITERTQWSRVKSALSAGIVLWILGIFSILSFNYWEDVTFFGLNFFDAIDYLTANLMMPIAALLTAIFAGWVMKKESLLDELGIANGLLFKSWLFAVRFIVPIGVMIVFLSLIGLNPFS